MTNVEELVEKIKSGKESKEVLYNAIKPFLDYQEKKYKGYVYGGSFEYNEIKSIIWLGVERAIETYHSDKNCKFLTWASSCIKYIFINGHNKTKGRETPINIIADSGEELSLEEIVEDESALDSFDDAETKIDAKKAIKALKSLPEEERKIIILTYIKNIPPTKIAEGMGISKGRARTLRLSALKKLKKAISS